jgi:hypothetical protein
MLLHFLKEIFCFCAITLLVSALSKMIGSQSERFTETVRTETKEGTGETVHIGEGAWLRLGLHMLIEIAHQGVVIFTFLKFYL